ncbi:amidohydrolase [Saccharomonospora viridis]|jgi:imidazolonepropionase-like amidohydrolase|uniref:Amidohydrolase, imidazolonepropionase n=2 Tax=Saccharomonospora viridis TaxID=1852 RepID=C7N0C6_SACVD|nr:amidohydrolase [Saccharomonospora viridis]ACU98328.1 amidohydrolase, imidazolonepropionase [Saccharomonospora viridis DSM 43017]KHF44122.1 amidohydrolase [Saccharomonospora viridis]SFP57086.1 Imidazolonepropionase [Saccharomonospora viridis]
MTTAIIGGYVVPVDGDPIDGGTVLLDQGKIVAVGTQADVEVPDDAELVDASGSWVLPGFIDAHVHLGVHEDGEGWSGNDTNEMTDPNGARFRAIDGIDPYEVGFDDALAGGVTSVVIKPGSGNPIGGETVGVKTWGRTVVDMLFADRISVKSALGENPKRVYGEKDKTPATRLGVAAVLREAFTEARNYAARREHARAEGKPFEVDLALETLSRVLDGELYWDQHTHRADDIVTAVRLAEEFGYKLVVNHGTEAHLVADFLAERDIPVILGPLFTSRSKVELRQRTLRSAGILARAGVRLAITTDHPVVPINFLVHQATLAVKEGLDPDTALRALTVNPAQILGLDERVGALKPGLDADVVIWSGDPLDVMSRALRVFVRGRQVYHFDETTGEGVVADRRYRE